MATFFLFICFHMLVFAGVRFNVYISSIFEKWNHTNKYPIHLLVLRYTVNHLKVPVMSHLCYTCECIFGKITSMTFHVTKVNSC